MWLLWSFATTMRFPPLTFIQKVPKFQMQSILIVLNLLTPGNFHCQIPVYLKINHWYSSCYRPKTYGFIKTRLVFFSATHHSFCYYWSLLLFVISYYLKLRKVHCGIHSHINTPKPHFLLMAALRTFSSLIYPSPFQYHLQTSKALNFTMMLPGTITLPYLVALRYFLRTVWPLAPCTVLMIFTVCPFSTLLLQWSARDTTQC